MQKGKNVKNKKVKEKDLKLKRKESKKVKEEWRGDSGAKERNGWRRKKERVMQRNVNICYFWEYKHTY